MDQGQKTYEYHGWQFERHDDGSLTVQPNQVQETTAAEKMDFTSLPVENRNLLIPKDELSRIISFWLTGRVDEDVVSQIQNLGRAKSTV